MIIKYIWGFLRLFASDYFLRVIMATLYIFYDVKYLQPNRTKLNKP